MGFPTHLSVADALVDQQGALCGGLHSMGRGAEGACMEENRGLGRGTLAKDFFFFLEPKGEGNFRQKSKEPLCPESVRWALVILRQRISALPNEV